MQNPENAYSEFLETHAGDQIFSAFQSAMREAFMAGYRCGQGSFIDAQPADENS